MRNQYVGQMHQEQALGLGAEMGEEGPRALFGPTGPGAASPSWPPTSFLLVALLALPLLLAVSQRLWLLVLALCMGYVHL